MRWMPVLAFLTVLVTAGCATSLYAAAGQGALDRGDPAGALESFVAARKYDRSLMDKAGRKRLLSQTATAVRGVLQPIVERACARVDNGAPALAELLAIYQADGGLFAELSVEERAAVRRRALACIGKAMRASIGYQGLAPTKYSDIRKLAGRIALLRRQAKMPRKADIKAEDPGEQLAAVLQQVATPGLSGMWGVCDALVEAGRLFEALELGWITHVTTNKGAQEWQKLRGRVAEVLRARAVKAKGYPDLQAMLRSLAKRAEQQGIVAKKPEKSAPKPAAHARGKGRDPIAWTVGRLTMNRCDGAVLQNLNWRLPTNSFSREIAVVDVHLDHCDGGEQWHVEDKKVRIKRELTRQARYRHTFDDYSTTWDCELTNTIKSRRCKADGAGAGSDIVCRTESTLEKVCRPTAHPLQTTKLVTLRTSRTRSRRFKRRIHHGTWTFSVQGRATVRWADRAIELPIDVRVKREGSWWKDKHGEQAKPDLSTARIRQLAVEEAVAVIHHAAVSILAPQAHAAQSAARVADHHKDERGWVDHTLRAARFGTPPARDQLERLGRFVGIPHGHYRLQQIAPGRMPRHHVKPGLMLAELHGGDVRVAPHDPRLALPKPRRDRFVENLRSIVQGPIVMPKKSESHYEAVGWLGPSPLDDRRMVPRFLAKARLGGWFGLGFGGDLEALGQGTRGWMAEVSAGPTLSDSFAMVEVFGRVRQHRLLQRADKLGFPDGPTSLDNVDVGLRASSGGPFGVYVDAAYNAFGLTEGGNVMRNHPIGLGGIIDLRVITIQAGLTYWLGDRKVLTWQGGLGLRL